MPDTKNMLELIGNTPIVEVTKFDTGLCRLFVKLENQNPGGSIKDRIALSMIEAAEKAGKIKPGGLLIEATAGNTGLSLALVSVLKGYKLILVIPDKMSREKIAHLRAMGVEITLTRSDVGKGHPEYYQDLAERIAQERGAYYINQFGNLDNPLAHQLSTGPEILAQMEGDVDAVICGVGSGGTITGLSKYFAEKSPKTEMVLADPKGSILAHYIDTGELLTEAGSWIVEGIGEDFIPSIADLSRCKTAYTITDAESCDTARELLKREGILAGSSAGTLVTAALKYCRDQKTPKKVVTFICDSGNKYLSKMFNDFWMIDQGFLKGSSFGDLRDIISRKHSEGHAVTIGTNDALLTAYSRMKLYDISQLPVVEGGKIVGMIDESDLLMATLEGTTQAMQQKVGAIMAPKMGTVGPETSLEDLAELLKHGLVAIVEDRGKFLGIITRIDLLNYLRRKAIP
jgi:cystathionine beta-synthase